MVRRVNKLSEQVIAQLTKPGYYGDGNNLYLQVSASGTKSWLFIYASNGRQHEMGLGSLNNVSLRLARKDALAKRKLLLEGFDPIMERRERFRLLREERARERENTVGGESLSTERSLPAS